MKDRINLDDPDYQNQVTIQDKKAKILWAVFCAIAVIVICAAFVLQNGSGGNSDINENGISHTNCMFIGYADPNRQLTGQTIISAEPKYGYRPVYVDRADIYNTYHFH